MEEITRKPRILTGRVSLNVRNVCEHHFILIVFKQVIVIKQG